MKKIKVMHCLGQLNTGGAETLVMNILRNIDREKYQFDFLLFNDNPGFYDKEANELGANIFYTPSMTSAGVVKYINNMVKFFKSHDIDVVHSHMDWQGGFIAYAAYKAGIKKIIVHSHANQKMFDRNIVYHTLITINKYLINKYATHCLACSKEAGESLFNIDFEVLINGIDMNKYINPNQEKILQLKQEFNLLDTDIVLGHVGSFSKNKNQEFLIDLLNELVKENSNYKLILVGDGGLKPTLEEKVNQLNLNDNVIFTGVRSEIPEIMHLFDIFLFPSIMEGLGIVAIEAQASGLPCIVSDSIPKDVDLELDLLKFTELDLINWINEIKNINHKINQLDYSLVNKSEFNICNTCNKLKKLY